jgi:hypothetical protein
MDDCIVTLQIGWQGSGLKNITGMNLCTETQNGFARDCGLRVSRQYADGVTSFMQALENLLPNKAGCAGDKHLHIFAGAGVRRLRLDFKFEI